MQATIYHNPRCSKSRQTLSLLQENNIDVIIIEYLKTPPTKIELENIIKLLGIKAEDLIRKKEEYNKSIPAIDAMIESPKAIERPIVIYNNKAVIGRPPESVLSII